MADKPTNEIRDAIKKILGDHYSSYLGEAGLTNITEWHNGNTSPTKSEMCPFGTVFPINWVQPVKEGRTSGGVGGARVTRIYDFAVCVYDSAEDLEILDERMSDYMDLLCVVLEYYWDFDVVNILNSDVMSSSFKGAYPASESGWHFQSIEVRVSVSYKRTLGA